MSYNDCVCDGGGIGGLGNEAKRNAKTDLLRPVPRDAISPVVSIAPMESTGTSVNAICLCTKAG